MKQDEIAPPARAEKAQTKARWRNALRLGGGGGALVWILLSWVNDIGVVNVMVAHNDNVAEITMAHVTTLVNCAVALGLCVALYVLSTIGQ